MAKTGASHFSFRLNPVTVVAGTELFLRREFLEQIRSSFCRENDSDLGYIRLDETASVQTILDECRTMSMFAAKKLVVVDPADALFRSRGGAAASAAGAGGNAVEVAEESEMDLSDGADAQADGGAATARELILKYAQSPSDNCTLVLVCSTWLKTTRLHKFLEGHGAIHICDALKEHAVPSWITQRTKGTYAKAIRPDAAMRLVELIGPDLAALDGELQKLVLYIGEAAEISVAAVNALVGFQYDHKVWDFVDALAEGDTRMALQRHDELWQMDNRIGYTLVGAVFYWLNQVLKARELLDRRLPEKQIVQDLRLYPPCPPQRAKAILAMARRWGLVGASRASAALLAADMASKTSVGDPRRNMECFIVRLGGK